MWTEAQNDSKLVPDGVDNTSEMVDPDLTWQALQRNGSTAAAVRPSSTEDALNTSNGIIPGAIAAAMFITMLLGLYAVLWKCMVSPPQRKRRKIRARLQQRTSA
ncbi:uncharacterized protein sb:cb288 [Syngnathoides biaculeatus]|uniref:uncharacterized protein sb:cb288 n=1 Tax=Syngnathoides biaculeatus TaxID=300417 RepID=UPI002ADDDE73|nr:uncharacterized protein sb:cb288 [Syngnathoides biaculeatus]